MTIASTARKAGPLLGNGSATAFPFAFKVFSAADIQVAIADSAGVETVLEEGTHYTVSLNANQETSPGGSVTYPVSGSLLPAGSVLSIIGDLDYAQPLDLPSGGNFSPLALENQLDRQTIQIQQLKEQVDRAAKLPQTSTETPDVLVFNITRLAESADNLDAVAGSLPAVNTVAASIANVNAVGSNIANVNTVADISANVTTVAGVAADVTTVATNLADVTNFSDVYYGPSAADPVLRTDGSALQPGDLYFYTGSKRLRVFDGTAWVDGPINAGTITRDTFSGTGAQAAFTLSVDPVSENNTQVFIGGVYQQKSEYSVSGTTLTFSTAPVAGTDNIEVLSTTTLALGTGPDLVLRSDLATTGAGKGAEMVGFKYPSAWSIATNLKLRGENFVFAEDGGATPDGSDVSVKLQAILNAGRVVVLQAGKTYVASNLTSATGAGLVCIGGRAKIAVPAGNGLFGLHIKHNDFTLDGVDFDGGNMGPFDGATPPALGTRIGVNVGLAYGTGHQQTGCTVRNCDVYGFDRVGIQGLEVVVGYSAGKRIVYDNVHCYNNHYNWSIDQNHEYCSFTNCYGYKGQIGIQLIGGNNMFTASMFTYNWINCQLMPGANQQHGAFVGCSFNHANAYGLDALNVVNGEVFTGCMFWYAPIRLRNCAGVAVTNSQIANTHITVDGGGVNWIDDNYMPLGLNKTLVGLTFTSFRRNRTTPTETSYATVYGDAFIKANASTYAYPIAWNVTTDLLLPLSFSDTRWHGENLPSLGTGGFCSVPRTGQYRLEASVGFDTLAAAEKVTLKAVIVRASVDVETFIDSAEFTASQSECMVKISKTVLLQAGDAVQLRLKTRTATGISVPAGGIDFRLCSVD